jgi:hypothetical protein
MTFHCCPRNTSTVLVELAMVVEAPKRSRCVAPLMLSDGSMWSELNASN